MGEGRDDGCVGVHLETHGPGPIPGSAPPSWLRHSMAPSCHLAPVAYGSRCHSTGRVRSGFVQSTQDLHSAPSHLP